MDLENQYATLANKVLFCDTDLLETKVYSETYYSGICDPLLDAYAVKNQYDLYFLTYIDTPWVPDDLRDRPNERLQMFEAFHQALLRYDKPFVLLKGNQSERFNFCHKDNR
jgi:nicotinamide riboside kinase